LQYELDVPIEVKVGTIGRISLSIPWTGLYTQSVTVTVEVRKRNTFDKHSRYYAVLVCLSYGCRILLAVIFSRIKEGKFSLLLKRKVT
jgi:hypothetical protein